MKVSFVIPAYNEEAVIGECLKSLIDAQTECAHLDTEIIVVNNNSSDSTEKIANSFPKIIVINEKRKGVVWSRQAGFDISSGDLIANIDADTIIPEGWITKFIHEFSIDPSLVALTGPHIYYDMPLYVQLITKLWYVVGFGVDYIEKLFTGTGSLFQGGNYVVRREALQSIGGYDTNFKFYGEDVDTGKRLSSIGKVKWTFLFPMYASGRRLKQNGIIKTGHLYAMSFIWVTFLNKPFTQIYNDIRIPK